MKSKLWAALAGLVLLALFAAAPARAEWRRAESPNFIVFSEAEEAALRGQVAQLEDFDQLLRALTGTTRAPAPANKLNIYMVRGTPQLRIVMPGASRAVGGFYSARPTGTAAFVDATASVGSNPGDPNSGLQVLFHEYAHHFMLQYFPTVYPTWYVEGFAEFMMYTRIDGPVIEYGGIGTGRAIWLTQTEWLDFDRMMFQADRLRMGEDVAKFYAQSWLTVHYLFRDPERRAALGRYLTAFARGETSPAAFQAAFGMRPGHLQAAVQRYAGSGQIPVTRITRTSASRPPAITITRLGALDDLLLLQAGLRIGVRESQRAAFLARVRREAARQPSDPFAQRVLAHAEAVHGDGAAAERLLTPLLAQAPNDAELLYLRGMRHLVAARAGDAEQARQAASWFARAHRADRNHFPTLYAYAQARRGTPDYLSENNANILLLAHQLAPQVAPIRLEAAALLMNRDQFSEAEALLLPLTAEPHARRIATSARELLAKARARERAGDVRFEDIERGEDDEGKWLSRSTPRCSRC